tara:strand:- start:281 stop:997 length:717 start_codon:yes stop_codon:yes gene_type:complete
MVNQKKLSRRIFAAGILSTGICQAAAPLINLSQKPALVDFSNKGNLFRNDYKGFVLDEKGFYNDPEPDLIKYDPDKNNFNHSLSYKPKRDFELVLFNANTNEEIVKKIKSSPFYNGIDYKQLDYFFRDWRENTSVKMNRQVIDILLQICESALGVNEALTVQITSGYRTRKTNSYLRSLSKNVAKNSLHMYGQAIDFNIENIPYRALKRIAEEQAYGGLGVYDNFIHVDSGPFRRWSS